jgi:hypothetical protein
VEPYWCKLEKAERMTKSTFLLLVIEKEGVTELKIKEITYNNSKETEEEVNLKLTVKQ